MFTTKTQGHCPRCNEQVFEYSDLGYEIEIIGEENGLVTNHQFCVE